MAKIEKKQSEFEKALNEAYASFKNNIEAILYARELDIAVEITGIKLSTLAVIVEESEDLKLQIYQNCGIDNSETHSHVVTPFFTLTNKTAER